MNKSAHPFGSTCNQHPGEVKINVYDFRHWAESWVFDAKYRQCSKSTIENHKGIHKKVLWFCEHHGIEYIDADTLRRFFVYLDTPSARWGNTTQSHCQRPASRSTVNTYYSKIHAFFNWCVEQRYIDTSPMQSLRRPLKSQRTIEPFTEDELRRLVKATTKSKYPTRDTAIIHLLLGTGLRASEFCEVRCQSVNWDDRSIRVVSGKGDKERVVRFGSHTRRLIYDYAKTRGGITRINYLFLSERGEPLTRSGLGQIVERLGRHAGLNRDDISPHTFRHTFATNYLIDGGNVYALMRLLGHETLSMTNKYVEFAETYIALQHRQHAPDDALYR